MSTYKLQISIAILLIFHLIGIGGILLGDSGQFLQLTPLNLLLTLLVLAWNHSDWKHGWIFALSYLGGFIVEVIGVNTGWPFGTYIYGTVLGPQLFSTPIMIGVNWLMLLYATNAISKSLSLHFVFRITIASLLMTGLDLFIEPVAIQLNFWSWSDSNIPFSNYVSWFIISAIISIPWQWNQLKLNSKIGVAVFLIQLGFFLALNFLQ